MEEKQIDYAYLFSSSPLTTIATVVATTIGTKSHTPTLYLNTKLTHKQVSHQELI